MNTRCPECGWPTSEHVHPASTHGAVQYLRCVCGVWLVLEAGRVVAAAGGTGSTRVRSS